MPVNAEIAALSVGASAASIADRLEDWLLLGLRLLELVAVGLGLLLATILVVRGLRSVWQVTFRGVIAVLPFEGSDKAPMVGQLLPQRWVAVEAEWNKAVHGLLAEKPQALAARPAVSEAPATGHDR